MRLHQQLFVTDILHFFYTPEKGSLRRFLPNRRLRRREQAQLNTFLAALAATSTPLSHDLGAHLAVPPKPHPATCNGPFVEVAPLPAWRGRDQLKTGKMVSLSGRAIDECEEDAQLCH